MQKTKSAMALVFCCLLASTLSGCGFLVCQQNEYPVCGDDGETHNNPCIANRNNADIEHYGFCEGDESRGDCDSDWEPVCVNDDETWTNKCLAESYTPSDDISDGTCDG